MAEKVRKELVKAEPRRWFPPFEDMEREFASIFRRPLSLLEPTWWPRLRTLEEEEVRTTADIFEEGNDVVVKTELPGMKKEDIDAAHDGGSVYWLYENDVTTKCLNPAYARYIYGYYTWMNHIDGMSSWTFQNTQNARGLPGRVGVDGGDIYLAYPDPKGPLATLKWEAVREGIDDHKLVYQLVKRLRKLKEKGVNVSKYETFLQEIEQKRGTPDCQISDDGRWNPVFFRTSRDQLISMILDAQTTVDKYENKIDEMPKD